MKYLILLFLLLFCRNPLLAQIGKSLVLNGCTDFLEVPETDLLDYNDILSIECWIAPNCDDNNRVILGKEWCVGEMSYYLSVFDGRLFWRFSEGGYCQDKTSSIQSKNKVIQSHTFTHVAVVHGQSEVKLFINGTLVDSEYISGFFRPIFNSNQEFRVGAYKNISGNFGSYFSGLIDEIRVWDIPLTEDMIQANMNTPLNGNENGLILYLDMESDQSGSGISLSNQANIPENLTATSAGFTSETPYFVYPDDYSSNPLNFLDQYLICDDDLILTLGINNYKSVVWSTGAQGNSVFIANSGTYSVTIETELCKYFSQDIEVIKLEKVYEEENVYICPEDTYEFQGQFLSPNSSVEFILPGVSGCDTTLIINVFEIPKEELSFLGNDITTCNGTVVLESPYENTIWDNQSIGNELLVDTEGVYYAEATDELGCQFIDSISVLFEFPFKEITVEICKDDLYPFDNQLLPVNSSTTFFIESTAGCDTILLINVVEASLQYTSFLGDDIASCNLAFLVVSPFENTVWNTGYIGSSLWVEEDGEYIAMATDELGCTYLDTIYVSIGLPSKEITVEICKDDLFLYNGELLSVNTSSTFIIENPEGCDSLIQINVLETPPEETSFLGDDITTCANSISLISPYENTIWDGGSTGSEFLIEDNGVYFATATDEFGCVFTDSIAVLFDSLPFKEINVEICKNDLYPFNGQLLGVNTSNTFIIENLDGCDSLIQINILETPPEETSFLGDDVIGCDNSISLLSPYENTIWDGNIVGSNLIVDAGGIYSALATDELGCIFSDSILVSFESNTKEIFVSVCEDEFYDFHGEQLPPNTQSIISIANPTGCDSIFTVYVDAFEAAEVFEEKSISICQEEISLFSPFDSTIWNNEIIGKEYVVNIEGSYSIQAIDTNGCRVEDTIYVEINNSNFHLPNVIAKESMLNNCFKPFFTDGRSHNYSLKIYDRWGNKLFSDQGTDISWCGYYKNKAVSDGVYVYRIELQNLCGDTTTKIGTLTVL